jgi:hypothetical protein
VLDFIYVGIAIAFFAIMLLYVRVCRMLGARTESEDQAS